MKNLIITSLVLLSMISLSQAAEYGNCTHSHFGNKIQDKIVKVVLDNETDSISVMRTEVESTLFGLIKKDVQFTLTGIADFSLVSEDNEDTVIYPVTSQYSDGIKRMEKTLGKRLTDESLQIESTVEVLSENEEEIKISFKGESWLIVNSEGEQTGSLFSSYNYAPARFYTCERL